MVNDPAVRTKLSGLIKGAKAIDPNANISVTELTKTGTMKLSISGITMAQGESIGLTGNLVTFHGNDGKTYTLGSFETGHILGQTPAGSGGTGGNDGSGTIEAKNKVSPDIYASVLQGKIPDGFWLSSDKVMTRVRVPYLINGGGKGDDRTGYRDKDVEVTSLTDAWKTSKQD